MDISAPIIIFLSFLPCIFWLIFFYFQDWYDREPIWLIAATFVLGILSTVGALVGNTLGIALVQAVFGKITVLANFIQFFFVVGPIEEAVKLLAVFILAYHRHEFDEPVDGVVYSAAAALGFAAAENVLYVYQTADISVLAIRGPLSNAGHAFFSAFWGLALSRAKAAPNIRLKRLTIILVGWLGAAVIHGFYDFILTVLPGFGALFAIFLLMGGMFAYVEFQTIRLVMKSPRRKGTQLLQLSVCCSNCGQPTISGLPCNYCNKLVTHQIQNEARVCPQCRNLSPPGSLQCCVCGNSLLKIPNKALSETYPCFMKVYQNGHEEIAYIINQQEVLIGKTLDNPFVINDESASKKHARIVWNHQIYAHVIEDLGSTNGTFVNGQRISDAALYNGFEVRIGQLQFVYRTNWHSQYYPPPQQNINIKKLE